MATSLSQQITDLENLKILSKNEFDTKIQSLEQAKINYAKALNSSGENLETEIEKQNLNAVQQDVESLKEQIQSFDSDLANLRQQEAGELGINQQSGTSNLDKYRNAEVVGDPSSNLDDESKKPYRNIGNEVNFGAEPKSKIPANINFKPLNNSEKIKDLRVKLRIPSNYLLSTETPELNYGLKNSSSTKGKYDKIRENGGIIFPYTPNIVFNYSVAYSKQNPMHSNYALNFYKNSEIGNIQIQAKFTVQNNADAEMFIASTQLLYLMTKMRFGNDPLSGLPPPICRLDAYGTYMLSNVPVSVATVTVEYPENVDYFIYEPVYSPEDRSALPTISNISVTVIPMYSREEMLNSTVDLFINNFENQKKKGYL